MPKKEGGNSNISNAPDWVRFLGERLIRWKVASCKCKLCMTLYAILTYKYSVTHMDSYRSKLVFWPLFKGLETCPSRFVMGSTVHFIFWNNVQTKWIFEFWPYFQKIPMWKHKKLENWRSNFPNFIPDIKMYAPCNNKNVFKNSQ